MDATGPRGTRELAGWRELGRPRARANEHGGVPSKMFEVGMLLVIRLLDDIAELLLYHGALPILPLLSWNVVPGDLKASIGGVRVRVDPKS